MQTRVTSFVGTLKIQGTLQKDPANTDWVDIDNIVIGDGSTALTNSYSTTLQETLFGSELK